jgi:hypothetical protein
MGRQFRFYLHPSDANALVDQLRDRFGAKVFLDYSPKRELFEIDAPYREDSTGILKPMNSNDRFYLAPHTNQLLRNFYPKPSWWCVDSDSEGIEFSGCKFDGTTILIGRFWYQKDFVRDLQFISKSNDFLKWAESVYRYTKRFLNYDGKIDAYVGEAAMKFRQNGGQFILMIGPNGRVVPA